MDELSRQEVDAKFAAAEARVDARLANLEAAMRIGFAELRVEIERLQITMHKNTANLIKWLVITALGFATLTIGILTFVINSSRQAEPRAATTVQRMSNQPTPPLHCGGD